MRNITIFIGIAALVAAQGCGADQDSSGQASGPSAAGGAAPGVTTPGVATPGVTTPGVTAPGVTTPGAIGAPTPSPAPGDFCGVKTVVQNQCGNCHGAVPNFGAPMPLVTHADFMATSPLDGRPYYQVMMDRVVDTARPMPPPPGDLLTPADVSTLQAWVDAGAQDNANCAAAAPAPTPSGDGTCIDCGTYTCDPAVGQPLQFRAHGVPVPGDETAFNAGPIGANGQPDSYECFYFKAPWAAGDQSIGFKPIIDNAPVLHHWLLYASETAPGLIDGGMASKCQAQGDPNRILLAGWAPGTPGQNLPTGVGQKLPAGPNTFLTLEVHYYNSNPGPQALDRSGVELCMANTPQPNVATQHWLGTEKIVLPPGQITQASDTCTPSGQATIISITPHMHTLGTRSTMVVNRANGQTETILDKAFSFDNQTTYPLDPPVVINPGDTITTTCEYENTTGAMVPYGEASGEEMCYLYTTAYPAGALHNGKAGCAGPFCIPGGTARCIDNENILDAVNALP